jgi:hypothetical protein
LATKNGITETQQSHIETAQARMQELRAMRLVIPNFVIPATKNLTQRLTSAASVPPPFVELTAVAVKNSTSLVRPTALTPEEVRGLMSYADAYTALADEAEALAHFIRHSVAAAKHRAGTDALTTYAVAQQLAKRPEGADLAPYVEDMRRALGRSGKKKAAAVVPPVQPEPAKPAPAKTSPDAADVKKQ